MRVAVSLSNCVIAAYRVALVSLGLQYLLGGAAKIRDNIFFRDLTWLDEVAVGSGSPYKGGAVGAECATL